MFKQTKDFTMGFFKTLLYAFRIRNIVEFRQKALVLAEVLDAYRIVPRLTLYAYGYLIAWVVMWYSSLPRIPKIVCDPAVLERLKGLGLSVPQMQELACRTTDVIGPTSAETVLVTAVCGMAPLVLGLYYNSGRSWDKNPSLPPNASVNTMPNIPGTSGYRPPIVPNVPSSQSVIQSPISRVIDDPIGPTGPRDPEARG